MKNYYESFFEEKKSKKVMTKTWMMLVFIFSITGVSAAEKGTFYTINFFIFLWLAVLVIIIVGVFVWLWIRGPVNKWTKK